jgi:hypothetical protein
VELQMQQLRVQQQQQAQQRDVRGSTHLAAASLQVSNCTPQAGCAAVPATNATEVDANAQTLRGGEIQ